MMIPSVTFSGKFKSLITCSIIAFFVLSGVQLKAQTPEAEKNFQACKVCHNISGPKLIGPTLSGILDRRDKAWIYKFVRNSTEVVQSGDAYAVKIFEENNKIPMPPHNLTDAQIDDILAYINNGGKVAAEYIVAVPVSESEKLELELAAERALQEQKQADMQRDANRSFGTTFYITLALLLIVLIDLFGTKIIKSKLVHITVILISFFVIGEIMYKEAAALGRQQYYQPDQPIWFSHKVHATQNKIDCLYCHSTAESSRYAGIPPTNVCLNCHSQVRQGKITGTVEIDKIYKAVETNKPVEWIKVHNLPDHVFFSHAQHVKAGKLACADCHGDVTKMDVVMQVNDLSMGWCLDCHRKTEVQFANNAFYKTYEKLHEQMKNGEIKKVTADMVGGTDCMKCHY
ncbi:MAG: c-type cytochrome [Bacteroidales bacterium]|nr:c-type cytochrome [Bacteroidales bacterium]